MKERKFISHSPEETLNFAKQFARGLKPGEVVGLEGQLGSGKTTFIKGMALGLGLNDSKEVKSPTFVLLHIYPTRIPLYHFDLYRLENLAELETIGFEEFIADPNAISCVEWAEKSRELLPPTTRWVQLEIVDEHSRKIFVRPGLP
jgi:tRNA threonylcarbamoyladenosine biosynthesis protein TsaE